MARLTWDNITERLFETGVKNCVLYVRKPDGSYNHGVAWNGLTAVSQNPEGAEPTDIFADDIKYLVLRSPENFKASIEAYTYPEEFLPCEGTAIPIPGVYIDQQPYQTFSICYKTSIGNDTDGDSHGYKIHIIYNCLAAPSEKDYGTIDDDPDAITFNWELDSIPMLVDGFKPASSITIDSTKIDPEVLQIIEDTLYGTELAEPTLMSPNDISNIIIEPSISELLIDEEGYYILIGGDRIIIGQGASPTPPEPESSTYYTCDSIILTGNGDTAPTYNETLGKYITRHYFINNLDDVLPKDTRLKLTATIIIPEGSSIKFSTGYAIDDDSYGTVFPTEFNEMDHSIDLNFDIQNGRNNFNFVGSKTSDSTNDIIELKNVIIRDA